jgi:hypothetical protein
MRISKLTQTIAEALANGNENFATELDEEADLQFGLKERFGAVLTSCLANSPSLQLDSSLSRLLVFGLHEVTSASYIDCKQT